MGVWGLKPQWGPGAKPLVRGQRDEAPLKLMTFSYFRDYHINLGNLDYMASVRACLCEHKGWGTVPLFIYFLQQASADCHCMLAGESRISSNMTISAFYRTQKLQFNIPQTYLCLIIRIKIGLTPAIVKYRPIKMEPSRCHVILKF